MLTENGGKRKPQIAREACGGGFSQYILAIFGGGEGVEQEPEDEQQSLSLWLSHLSLSRAVFAAFHFVLGLCEVNQALKLG